MYEQNTKVKTLDGKTAIILSSSTVEIEHEDGTYSESTTYNVRIAGQGTTVLHETKILEA